MDRLLGVRDFHGDSARERAARGRKKRGLAGRMASISVSLRLEKL